MKRLRLDQNENPYGCSMKVQLVATEAIRKGHRYPTPFSVPLTTAIADFYSISPNNVWTGNGADELLFLLANYFRKQSSHVIGFEQTFPGFFMDARYCDDPVTLLPLSAPFFQMQLMQLAEKAQIYHAQNQTVVIYLCHPNNPTGEIISAAQWTKFINAIPKKTFLIVDEAYAEFAGTDFYSFISLATTKNNIIVLRTFSKAYGLAGFRLGYAIACEKLLNEIKAELQMLPFRNNRLAQKTGVAAIADQNFVANVVKRNATIRERTMSELQNFGLEVLPSAANFITMRLPGSIADWHSYFHQQKIHVCFLEKFNMPGYIRLSIGMQDDMHWVCKKIHAQLTTMANEVIFYERARS